MRRHAFAACLLLLSLIGCTSRIPATSKENQKGHQVEIYTADSNAVSFDIEPAQDPSCPGGHICYLATHEQKGATAKFRIDFEPSPRKIKDDFVSGVGKGRIVAVEGSNSIFLLQQLKQSLQATKLPSKVTRKPFITFEYAEMGNRLSHEPNRALNANPPGNWSANKLFFGNDEGETFLNLNPVLKKGEFSIKDPDYGNYLMAEFAKVL